MERRLTSQIIFVIFAALLQIVPWLTLNGVKVNLVLIVLLAMIFMVDSFIEYALMVVLAALLLSDQTFDLPILIFSGVILMMYFLGKLMPWYALINYILMIVFATIVTYTLIDLKFANNNLYLVGLELTYNLLFGIAAFLILAKIYEEQTRIKL